MNNGTISTFTDGPAFTLESILAAKAELDSIDQRWADSFNAAILESGIDLNASGTLFVSPDFDMSLVPSRYLGTKVKPSHLVPSGNFIFA